MTSPRIKKLATQLKNDYGLTHYSGLQGAADSEARARVKIESATVGADSKAPVGGERGYLAPGTTVEWARHFETKADLTVLDFELGSIGLVFILPKAEKEDSRQATLDHAVSRHLGDAAYLRHLLLTQAEAKGQHAPSVELIFLEHTNVPKRAMPQAHAEVGSAFRSQQRTKTYLPDIGVSYLSQLNDPTELRRAFPWLLTATRSWAQKRREGAAATSWPGFERLHALTLENYRSKGIREVKLARGAPGIHVLHGPNGSGKTALAESLEFVATGDISRLSKAAPIGAETVNYKRIVCHYDEAHASISLNGEEEPFEVAESSLLRPPSRPPFLDNSLSFRLNQAEIDGLITDHPAARGERFLRAFFPGEQGVRDTMRKADQLRSEALETLEGLLPDLQAGAEVLRRLGRWFVTRSGVPTGRPFKESLDDWLDTMALQGMGEDLAAVQAIIWDASNDGWNPDSSTEAVLPTAERVLVEEWLETTRGRHERALMELRSNESAQSIADAEHVTLSEQDVGSLDRLGKLILPIKEQSVPLGARIRSAIQENNTEETGWGSIGGEPQWADPLLRRAKELESATTDITALTDTGEWIPRRGKLFAAVNKVHEAESIAASTFESAWRESEISDAVNELMALFTPGRWAYRAISIRFDPDSEEDELVFEVAHKDSPPAELILNTAELTMLALALFLLNAPALNNPFKALILDDPLQNLDEMSVSAFSRGLAKLMRSSAWPDDWHLLLMAHSRADCDRIASEIPCHRYALPWLTPEQASGADTIQPEKGSAKTSQLLPISRLMRLIPSDGGSRAL